MRDSCGSELSDAGALQNALGFAHVENAFNVFCDVFNTGAGAEIYADVFPDIR